MQSQLSHLGGWGSGVKPEAQSLSFPQQEISCLLRGGEGTGTAHLKLISQEQLAVKGPSGESQRRGRRRRDSRNQNSCPGLSPKPRNGFGTGLAGFEAGSDTS